MRRGPREESRWGVRASAIFALALVALCLGFVGCGGSTDGGDGERPPSANADSEPETADSEADVPTEIEIPDVTGDDLESAVIEIEGEDLSVEYEDEEPDDASLCTVSDQDPAAGEPAEEDDAVTLTVECQVVVPDVTGDPAEDALSDLEDAGLDPSYETDPTDATVCTVGEQSLAADEEVEEDETITLTLACDVPDVTGEDPDSAESTLQLAGYTSTPDSYVDDPSLCTVESQDPIGDAEPGGDISLTLDCVDEDDGF